MSYHICAVLLLPTGYSILPALIARIACYEHANDARYEHANDARYEHAHDKVLLLLCSS